jgi:hypothetical protein
MQAPRKSRENVCASTSELIFLDPTPVPLESYPADSAGRYDPLKHYLMEIKRYPLLSREEETRQAVTLSRKGRNGGRLSPHYLEP